MVVPKHRIPQNCVVTLTAAIFIHIPHHLMTITWDIQGCASGIQGIPHFKTNSLIFPHTSPSIQRTAPDPKSRCTRETWQRPKPRSHQVKVGDVSGATCRPVDDQHLGVCSVSLGKNEKKLANLRKIHHVYLVGLRVEKGWKRGRGGAYCQLPITSLSGPTSHWVSFANVTPACRARARRKRAKCWRLIWGSFMS